MINEKEQERAVCAVICSSTGLRARDIARRLNFNHQTVNHILYSSPLLHELCWQDRDYRWHGIIRQERPHIGLQEFTGWYGSVKDFMHLSEEEWMTAMTEGCGNVGRSLNDTRGLLHSFQDCREQMMRLFEDLLSMLGESCLEWELAFEMRLKRSRHVRIYADVLVITKNRVFSLEFKMKKAAEGKEILQAAKYCPYLEIVFGPDYEIIPVLVLTAAHEQFSFERIGELDMLLPICSADMLFNVFDEYLHFLG